MKVAIVVLAAALLFCAGCLGGNRGGCGGSADSRTASTYSLCGVEFSIDRAQGQVTVSEVSNWTLQNRFNWGDFQFQADQAGVRVAFDAVPTRSTGHALEPGKGVTLYDLGPAAIEKGQRFHFCRTTGSGDVPILWKLKAPLDVDAGNQTRIHFPSLPACA